MPRKELADKWRKPDGANTMNCIVNKYLSSMCSKGTKGCTVDHIKTEDTSVELTSLPVCANWHEEQGKYYKRLANDLENPETATEIMLRHKYLEAAAQHEESARLIRNEWIVAE